MEVHHHPDSSPKKWKHYFWEFFMLFLAVFCGFLAENQREHLVEHRREKQFMRSLMEDLETDTVELRRAMDKADTVGQYSDSVLTFLSRYKISKVVPFRFLTFVGKAGQRQILINTDRTSSQLKNSGALRLVRNKKINDLILRYWKQIDETNISLERYMVYRNSGREISFKLWVIPEAHHASQVKEPAPIIFLRVIDEDSKKWDEFANLIAMGGTITRENHRKNLQQQFTMARELIASIKNEYHLE